MSNKNELGLLTCYYNSIGPLPIANYTDDGDVQARATYQFPHRDAQFSEAMGREPLTTQGEILFINGIAGDYDLFPRRYIQMKQEVRKKDISIFRHPFWGNVRGYFLPFTSHFSTEIQNGCKVSFTFHEVGSAGFTEKAIDPLPKAEDNAAIADAGLQLLQARSIQPPAPGQPTPTTLSEDIAELRTLFETADVLADEVRGAAAAFRGKVVAMLEDPVLQDPLNFEVYNALTLTLSSVLEAAANAASRAVEIIEFPLPGPMGPLFVAHLLYTDASRAEELIRLNPPKDFYWPKDFVLRVAA